MMVHKRCLSTTLRTRRTLSWRAFAYLYIRKTPSVTFGIFFSSFSLCVSQNSESVWNPLCCLFFLGQAGRKKMNNFLVVVLVVVGVTCCCAARLSAEECASVAAATHIWDVSCHHFSNATKDCYSAGTLPDKTSVVLFPAGSDVILAAKDYLSFPLHLFRSVVVEQGAKLWMQGESIQITECFVVKGTLRVEAEGKHVGASPFREDYYLPDPSQTGRNGLQDCRRGVQPAHLRSRNPSHRWRADNRCRVQLSLLQRSCLHFRKDAPARSRFSLGTLDQLRHL